ncbi:di-heme oxidoredictase family protein [Calidithermus chliarophilus]|uniref:di-heme oxidoredictase family protein n=1 Tax=Calidithermus chliarophilus TaxID=52023 RepID=UPI0012F6356D|nr:di-heme oxidoredictase family protein [Calidithermus chliarophilus]
MSRRTVLAALAAALALAGGVLAQGMPSVTGKVVAVGIPGVGALSPIGFFHPGGPIHDKPEFKAFTEAGKILEAERLFVASSSNFGAPKAVANLPEGSILSIDPRGDAPVVVPQDFAKADGQAVAAGGRVQLYTAQSPAFVNGLNNPQAVTAALPAVSYPLGISINNAFGRPWFTGAPYGAKGPGFESVTDPNGRPLAGAPSKVAGGVFSGSQTNRTPQVFLGGLDAATLGTAFLGKSPDQSGRAVFAVLMADGRIAQVHVEKGVDGLAPAGTIRPLTALTPKDGDSTEQVPTRAGMVFNWVPDRIIYVADPLGNAVVALTLADDGKVFYVARQRRIQVPEFSLPIDLAPAVPEVANPGFASNTTLAGNSDLYVLNRGNGTIVRVRQNGTVVAVRRVEVAGAGVLGGGRLAGIAVSSDAQKIYVSVSGELPQYPGLRGAVVELPAFGASGAASTPASDLVAKGAALFKHAFTPGEGLGPLFNARSCAECHASPTAGGVAPDGLGLATFVGRLSGGKFDPLIGGGGPVARAHSVSELGLSCSQSPGIPAGANLSSIRITPPLYGMGLVDRIPEAVILAGAVPKEGGVQGRPNWVTGPDGVKRVGRYGWKADVASLEQFVGLALRNEHGITNPVAPEDFLTAKERCPGDLGRLEDDGQVVAALTAFVRSLEPLRPRTAQGEGERLFASAGCTACHTPNLGGVPLYSDLLLHDMGPLLDDGLPQGEARGKDWRTAPLWGLASRQRFLHDGRANNLESAIAAHGGEAEKARTNFLSLTPTQRQALVDFLKSL